VVFPRGCRKVQQTVQGMRQAGAGMFSDAPQTQTGGAGGGSKPPPRVRGMLGPDNPSDEFPTFNGWKLDVRRSEIDTFTDESGQRILVEHDHRSLRPGESSDPDKSRFPVGFDTGEQVRDWVTEIIDFPALGKSGDPNDPKGFHLFGTYRGDRGHRCGAHSLGDDRGLGSHCRE